MKKTVLLLFALFTLSCNNASKESQKTIDSFTKSQDKIEKPDDFQSYWIEFREAIIKSDSLKLLELTEFPLNSHGVMDEDPQILINKDNFYYFLKVCLNEDTGMSISSETMLDYIIKTTTLEEGRLYSKVDDWCRVSSMEFKLINNKWKLTLIYFNTADYANK